MDGWIHFIDSKETYEELWEIIGKYRELYLGSFIIIDGSLTCKDGRVFGNEGEILAGITLLTLKPEAMENMFKQGIIDPSLIVLIDHLIPEEIILDNEGDKIIKKVIKGFGKPSEFKNYLREVHYKDFKEGA